jgi:hypothetical protein
VCVHQTHSISWRSMPLGSCWYLRQNTRILYFNVYNKYVYMLCHVTHSIFICTGTLVSSSIRYLPLTRYTIKKCWKRAKAFGSIGAHFFCEHSTHQNNVRRASDWRAAPCIIISCTLYRGLRLNIPIVSASGSRLM